MVLSPQKKRTTRPDLGRHGSTDSVDISGTRSRSEQCSARPDASNGMPLENALSSSLGIMATFLRLPNISQNVSLMNFTSFSSTNFSISFGEKLIFMTSCTMCCLMPCSANWTLLKIKLPCIPWRETVP